MFFQESKPSSKKILALSAIGALALLSLYCTFSSSSLSTTTLLNKDLFEQKDFDLYLDKHSKSYSTEEYPIRLQNFRDNMGYIRVVNSMNKSWYLKPNQFTDMSNTEFKTKFFPVRYQSESVETEETGFQYPNSVNWVNQGVVTGVKNQGQCGSCWAFSTTGAVEGAWALAGHGLVSLSEQQLVDCSPNYGCGGGWPTVAFQYIISNGITTESNYPYVAQNQNCNTAATSSVAATLTSYSNVGANNWQALATAVAQQPISVLVEADGPDWQSYGGGIVNDPYCGTNLDHAVLAVGYDMGTNPPSWLVKNSWGTGWGEGGYIQLAITDGVGICGVQMSPAFPIV